MFNKINNLNNLLEEITGNEVDIEIVKGKLLITITNNKAGVKVPNIDDVKLLDLDELNTFVSNLPEEV
jgi:nitrate reductase NapAB chaperone NapD